MRRIPEPACSDGSASHAHTCRRPTVWRRAQFSTAIEASPTSAMRSRAGTAPPTACGSVACRRAARSAGWRDAQVTVDPRLAEAVRKAFPLKPKSLRVAGSRGSNGKRTECAQCNYVGRARKVLRVVGRGSARTVRAAARRDDRSEIRSTAIVVCPVSRRPDRGRRPTPARSAGT